MRFVGLVLIALLAVAPAAAQNDDAASRQGAAAGPSGASKFRKPSAARAAALKARAAARRAQLAGQQQQAETAAPRAGATAARAAAAARKRAPAQPNAARDPVANLTPKERLLIELELAWVGEYIGLINAEPSDKLVAAIRSFQRNRKFKETGVLNTQERALLAAAAKARQSQVGWVVVDDPVTGARLGIPGKQIPNKTQGKSGTRWASAQGQVQVETFRIREPGTTIAMVFEQQKKEPANRKIETSVLKPDSFYLAGTQGLKKFHVRAEIKDDEVRGLTVLHDPAETIMDPVVIVMANAFSAFPGVASTAEAGVPPPKRKVEYGTGIVVSAAGHVITDRQVTDGCNVIVVSGYGNADLQAEDKTADLALIRVYGAPDLVPAALTADGVRGPDVTVVGIADPQNQGGGGAISVTPAQLRGDVIEPAPQLGFSGAAVLDGQGRMLGMAELKPQIVATLGAPNVQPKAVLVPAQTIRSFLQTAQLAPASGRSGVDAAKGSLVRVICVRK
jgi:trypsin-like peptidase